MEEKIAGLYISSFDLSSIAAEQKTKEEDRKDRLYDELRDLEL